MVRWCLAGVAIASAATAPAASAATRWSTPSVLATGGFSLPLQVRTLADGTSLAVLDYPKPDATLEHDNGHIEAAVRPPGGAFAAPSAVTGPGHWPGELVTNFAGDAVLYVGGDDGVRLRARPRGSGFQPVEAAPAGSAYNGFLDEHGTLTLTGGDSGGSPWVVTRHADGTYDTPRPVTTAPADWRYRALPIVEPDGTTTVVGRSGDQGSSIESIGAPASGDFAAPVTIASGSHSSLPKLVAVHDARGDALIAWNGGAATGTFAFGSLHTAYRAAGGAWGPVRDIPGDPLTAGVQQFDMAMDARGDAVLVWNALGRTAMSYRPAGGQWEQATQAPENNATEWVPTVDPSAAIGPTGDATVVYGAGAYSRCLDALDHPAEAGFQRAEPVLGQDWPAGGTPDVTVGPHGEALVGFWGRRDGGATAIYWATHRIAALPADAAPSVDCFGATRANGLPLRAAAARKPAAFLYNLAKRARVRIDLRRTDGGRNQLVGSIATDALPKGAHRTDVPDSLRSKLKAQARYRVSIVAIDKAGRTSRVRTLTFTS